MTATATALLAQAAFLLSLSAANFAILRMRHLYVYVCLCVCVYEWEPVSLSMRAVALALTLCLSVWSLCELLSLFAAFGSAWLDLVPPFWCFCRCCCYCCYYCCIEIQTALKAKVKLFGIAFEPLYNSGYKRRRLILFGCCTSALLKTYQYYESVKLRFKACVAAVVVVAIL